MKPNGVPVPPVDVRVPPGGDAVRLTAATARIIAQYAQAQGVNKEFERLKALAIWDSGRERWRDSDCPAAYLATAIRRMALEELKRHRGKLETAPLDGTELADQGEVPHAVGDLPALDSDVLAVIDARTRGVKWNDVAEASGWGHDVQRVEAARGRIRRIQVDGPRIAGTGRIYRERLNDSNRWCFSFQQSNFNVLEALMAEERKTLFSTRRPETLPARLIQSRDPQMNLKSNLQVELDKATDRLTILEKVHDGVKATVGQLQRDHAKASADARIEIEDSAREERLRNTWIIEAPKRIQAALLEDQPRLDKAAADLRKQQIEVRKLSEEIAAQQRIKLLAASQPKFERIAKLISELSDVSYDLLGDFQKNYIVLQPEDLFQTFDLTDRANQIVLFNNALRVAEYRSNFTRAVAA